MKEIYNMKNKKLSASDALYLLQHNENLNEQILNETKRLQFINKSKSGKKYTGKEGNRWDAKVNCHVANQVKDYNKIDMNKFWKEDKLIFSVKVQGETDLYNVVVEFNNIVEKIKQKTKDNNNLFTLNIIYKSLVESLNAEDIKISCDCADFQYRFSYWSSQHGEKSGDLETRKSNITNPDDKLGAGCKHILCVLNNAEWLHKLSSVINNYVFYARDHMEDLYARYIFPKIYGMEYKKAIQLCLDDYDEKGELKYNLRSDEAIINLTNALGKERGKIKKGSNKNPIKQERNKGKEKYKNQ